MRNKQTVLIYIALLQCTCQIYTIIAVFKIYKMIIIRYPRGTLYLRYINYIECNKWMKLSSPLSVSLRKVKAIVTVKKKNRNFIWPTETMITNRSILETFDIFLVKWRHKCCRGPMATLLSEGPIILMLPESQSTTFL